MPLFGKDRRAGNLLRIHRRAGCVKIPGEGGGADKQKRRKEQKTGVMLQCFWRRREDDHISILYVNVTGIRKTCGIGCPCSMGRYENRCLLCFCATIFNDTCDFGIGIYRFTDFNHCRDNRFCIIAGLGR